MGWESVRVFGGAPYMYTHVYVCTCAYMYKHDNFMQMAAPIGNSLGNPIMKSSLMCAHMHAFACMCTCA